MRFTVLGAGTTLSTDRSPAGFLLEVDGSRMLVDGGSGTLGRLRRAGVDPVTLDGGVVSHRHLDHVGDLAPLLFTLKVGGRRRDYPIWGGTGLARHLAALEVAHGALRSPAWRPEVNELPLDGPGTAHLPGHVTLRTLPATHGAGALHLRFEHARGAVVFSGDTAWSDALVQLATDADLLVVECALDAPDPAVDHLWPEAVAELLRRARPRLAAVTHLYPDVDPSRLLRVAGEAGVPVVRVRDGWTWRAG